MARMKIRRKVVKDDTPKYWSLHTHSRYSYNDALPKVSDIVTEAVRLGYPALGLTDHGNMSGSIELYRECKAAGIKPFPGSEFYLVVDRGDKKAKRFHCCIVAYTEKGYRNLVYLSTLSHENFHHKPLLDMSDLAKASEEGRTEGLAMTTGCYFGLVIQTLINDGYQAAENIVASFASWIDTYVEVQMHCIDQEPMTEVEIARNLKKIADNLSLPMVITQDSHYVHEEEKSLHEALKTLVSWSDDPGEAVFPGDSFHLADQEWMEDHHLSEVYAAGLKGLQELLDKNTLAIPEADEYHYNIPSKYDNPKKELRRRVLTSTKVDLQKDRFFTRVMEEIEVTEAAGMSGYLLMVADVCEYMRSQGMFYQIRGSAAGSLLCYLLDISDVEPLKWKLRFDRFLTKDRTKPPDIDIDIDSERRGELIEWLEESYAVCQIGTFGTYSMTSEDDEGKGSLLVKYYSRSRKVDGPTEWSEVPENDRKWLYALSEMELASGYGTHAAGLILTQTQEEMDLKIPKMWIASSKKMVSQYDMKIVEDLGLVKLDVLGVKTLAVIRRTLEHLGMKDKGTVTDLSWIPMSDAKTYRRIASGDTGGMFQLEGGTSRFNISRLRPTKIADVIAAMALFRPGVMSSGATDDYIDRKNRDKAVPEQHPILAKITKETFGIMLYQDQVIEVLRAIGMDVEGLNAILKALKASNKNVGQAGETINRYQRQVAMLCAEVGFSDEDTVLLWDAILGFKDYSFNRSHATVYGITAYRTAYLIEHHPVEYHAALLSVASSNKEKEKQYQRLARSRDIRLLRPNVNNAGADYQPDTKRGGVVRALSSIRGIGAIAASAISEHQPYRDLDDFIERVNQSKVTGVIGYKKTGRIEKGTLELLKDSGALEVLGVES